MDAYAAVAVGDDDVLKCQVADVLCRRANANRGGPAAQRNVADRNVFRGFLAPPISARTADDKRIVARFNVAVGDGGVPRSGNVQAIAVWNKQAVSNVQGADENVIAATDVDGPVRAVADVKTAKQKSIHMERQKKNPRPRQHADWPFPNLAHARHQSFTLPGLRGIEEGFKVRVRGVREGAAVTVDGPFANDGDVVHVFRQQ